LSVAAPAAAPVAAAPALASAADRGGGGGAAAAAQAQNSSPGADDRNRDSPSPVRMRAERGGARAPSKNAKDASVRRLIEVVVLPGARHDKYNAAGLRSLPSAGAIDILTALSFVTAATHTTRSLNTKPCLMNDDVLPALKEAFHPILRFGEVGAKAKGRKQLAGLLNVRFLDVDNPAELGAFLGWVEEHALDGLAAATLLRLFGDDGDGAATAKTASADVLERVRVLLRCALPLP
jgi:hypothetical protein